MMTSHIHQRLKDFLAQAKKPLIVVVGPTASGKTSLSVELAKEIGTTEIINADSRQLYRFLDIGTAKITEEEKQGIPHHLFDVLDPREETNAAWYKERAEECIEQIHARSGIPMLVGGSMLYISAVIDGLTFTAPSDPALRARLESEYDADNGAALYSRLVGIDPETASVFSQNNKPYVIRAMEIFETTKKKPSEARTKNPCPYELLIIGIQRSPKELKERINKRTEELFRRGWVDEVKGLLKKGYSADDPAMKSHGYREIIENLQSGSPITQEIVHEVAANTCRYAKRQMTWWRPDSRIEWIDA